jgi:predicted nucleic acid-binding protein
MPADAVFVNTIGWIASINADDEFHAGAASLLREFAAIRRPLVTTDWVLAETGNGLARTAARSQFVEAMRAVAASPYCMIVRVDAGLFERALALYEQAADKTWGFVDCASFTVMKDAGIGDALTSDQHFTQAGFNRLLMLRP